MTQRRKLTKGFRFSMPVFALLAAIGATAQADDVAMPTAAAAPAEAAAPAAAPAPAEMPAADLPAPAAPPEMPAMPEQPAMPADMAMPSDMPMPPAEPAAPAPMPAAVPGDLPHKGEAMAAVEHRYGAPKTRHAPVGGDSPRHPPITRWDYDGFSVFFEHAHVVDAVVPGAPPPIKHQDQLRAATP